MPFFFRVRIACVLRTIVTFWPSTSKVFFCRFGLKTRLVRRNEKLTFFPNCFPLPVSSHRAAIIYSPYEHLRSFNLFNCTLKMEYSQGFRSDL